MFRIGIVPIIEGLFLRTQRLSMLKKKFHPIDHYWKQNSKILKIRINIIFGVKIQTFLFDFKHTVKTSWFLGKINRNWISSVQLVFRGQRVIFWWQNPNKTGNLVHSSLISCRKNDGGQSNNFLLNFTYFIGCYSGLRILHKLHETRFKANPHHRWTNWKWIHFSKGNFCDYFGAKIVMAFWLVVALDGQLWIHQWSKGMETLLRWNHNFRPNYHHCRSLS